MSFLLVYYSILFPPLLFLRLKNVFLPFRRLLLSFPPPFPVEHGKGVVTICHHTPPPSRTCGGRRRRRKGRRETPRTLFARFGEEGGGGGGGGGFLSLSALLLTRMEEEESKGERLLETRLILLKVG